MLYLIMELRWWLAAAGGLGLLTGFIAKCVSKPKPISRGKP